MSTARPTPLSAAFCRSPPLAAYLGQVRGQVLFWACPFGTAISLCSWYLRIARSPRASCAASLAVRAAGVVCGPASRVPASPLVHARHPGRQYQSSHFF